MPIYEYECPTCGKFEVIQKFSDNPLSKCPTCQEKGKDNDVVKAVSASSFHLKGTGWYKTDYSSGSSAGSSSSKSSSSSSASSESGSSSDKASSDSSSSDSGTSSTAEKKACGTGCGCH